MRGTFLANNAPPLSGRDFWAHPPWLWECPGVLPREWVFPDAILESPKIAHNPMRLLKVKETCGIALRRLQRMRHGRRQEFNSTDGNRLARMAGQNSATFFGAFPPTRLSTFHMHPPAFGGTGPIGTLGNPHPSVFSFPLAPGRRADLKAKFSPKFAGSHW